MAAPQVARRRRMLPGAHATVDWAHPLAARLAGYVAPAHMADFARQNALTLTGSVPVFPTEMGNGRRTWDSSNRINLGVTGTPIVGDVTTFTVTVVARVVTTGSVPGMAFYSERGSAGNPLLKVCYGPAGSSGKLTIIYRDTGGSLMLQSGSTVINTLGTVVVSMRRTASTSFDGWVNGRQDVSGTSAGYTGFSEATLENRIGSDAGDATAQLASGCVAALVLHKRALSEPEIASLHDDPFQMLRF